MTPTAVPRANVAGGLGWLGLGGDAAPAAAEPEGFPGVLRAVSALQSSAEAAIPLEAVEEMVSDPAHEMRDRAAAEAENPGTSPLADLVALLNGCLGTPPTTPAVAVTAAESGNLAERDDESEPPSANVAWPGDATPRIPGSHPDASRGALPEQRAGGRESECDSSAASASPAGALRSAPTTPAAGAASAIRAGPPGRPYAPRREPAATGETVDGALTAVGEPHGPSAITPESAKADGQPRPPEMAEAVVTAPAPAGGASNASGVPAPEGGVAADGGPRRGIPEPIPPHADRSTRGESPAPTSRGGGAIADMGAPGPPESSGDLPERDMPPDARVREAPDVATPSPSRGGGVQGPVVATRTEAPQAPRERLEGAQTPLTQDGVDHVAHAVRTSLARGGMEVRLRLHPQSLGEVRVAVRWEGGLLTARLETTTPAARDTLEGGTQTLRASLQEQGIPLDRVSIAVRPDVQSHSQDHRSSGHTEPWPEPGASPRHPEPSEEETSVGRLAASDGRLDIRI